MAKLLIVGCGSLGTHFAQTLVSHGHSVTALKRHPPTINESGIHYIKADITDPASLRALSVDFDQVFFILAPDNRDEISYRRVYVAGLQNLLSHFAQQASAHIPWFFISSTSVYAQSHGEWVDEDTPAEPILPTSRAIRDAEKHLLALNPKHCTVRFSGIYGPGRDYLIRQARQAPDIQKTPPYYTNRIHEQDCINVLIFLLEQRLLGKALHQCYLASDDDPASQWEVMTWLADQLQCLAPSIKQPSDVPDQNKRCDNSRIKALGFTFQYPSYKEGYSALI